MKTLVILRKRSSSLREELPTKDLCISDYCSAKLEPTQHRTLARSAQVLRLLPSSFAGTVDCAQDDSLA